MKTLIQQKLLKDFPDAKIQVICQDLDGAHVTINIASAKFKNLTLIEQHQLVHKSLKNFLKDGRVHAVRIKTTIL